MIEGLLKDQLNVSVDLKEIDIAKSGQVIYLREEAENACRERSGTSRADPLKEVCAAALDMLDLVDELADEVLDLDLTDPEETVSKIIEWQERGQDALTRMKLLQDGAESVFVLGLTTLASIITLMSF